MKRAIQISLEDSRYAERLHRALRSDASFADCRIVVGEEAKQGGEVAETVWVIDLAHLPLLSRPPMNGSKAVLIASGAVNLEQVWEAGIVSVLLDCESLECVKLAILGALLRPVKPHIFPRIKEC